MAFDDISIRDIDQNETQRNEAHSGLFDVVLRLSASTPEQWSEYFNSRWEHEFYMSKRHACAVDDTIIITCELSELEIDHLPRLEGVIAETNSAYRDYLAKRKAKEAARENQEGKDKFVLDQLSKQLFKKS